MDKDILILIPAFNEEKSIAKVVIKARKYGYVIVCNDGSRDYTGEIARELGVEVIRHDVNRGYGAALRSLFKRALDYNPKYVVTLDADLQHDPEYIPDLIKYLEDNEADIVIGARLDHGETPRMRRMGIKLFSRLMNIGLTDVQSGYRVYRGSILRDLIPREDGMEASIEILDKAVENNYKILEYPVKIRYVGLDTSTEGTIKHSYNIFTRIIHSKIIRHPITYLGIPGILSVIMGLISGIWVIMRYIKVREVAIGTAIITAILIIIGVFLVLTPLQIYIFKVYVEMYRESK